MINKNNQFIYAAYEMQNMQFLTFIWYLVHEEGNISHEFPLSNVMFACRSKKEGKGEQHF